MLTFETSKKQRSVSKLVCEDPKYCCSRWKMMKFIERGNEESKAIMKMVEEFSCKVKVQGIYKDGENKKLTPREKLQEDT